MKLSNFPVFVQHTVHTSIIENFNTLILLLTLLLIFDDLNVIGTRVSFYISNITDTLDSKEILYCTTESCPHIHFVSTNLIGCIHYFFKKSLKIRKRYSESVNRYQDMCVFGHRRSKRTLY